MSKSPQMGMGLDHATDNCGGDQIGRKPIGKLNNYLNVPLRSTVLNICADRSVISVNRKNKHFPLSGGATEGDLLGMPQHNLFKGWA
ncbi:hypothetical protein SAMN02745220_02333 [Desulfopila aestuarii DSM 18488]|uniref:Uncharacterized protein n=1 Tax=Desulfopila aestuarii DSM 18488 TaxID=1121416 RepID=A0A1M7Y7J9_9BACT|nr:hypothetical protein SAMN02745220_02333 [Desulfopila aestuarii DSM 18488]